MANISSLLGTAGGFKGTGVESPDMNYVSPEMVQDSYKRNVDAQNQQISLLGALQGQNGLANQSSVYNQLQGVANGTGPNPAIAQLNQSTSANTANQAALMAGQRGSSANTGLIARQAAMTGAANQQQAVGQAATLQAQQSLGAMGQMGQIANTQVANQVGQTNANAGSAQAEQSSLLNANNAQNLQRSGLITATAGQQASFGGGLASGIGSAASAGAEGGKVENMPKMAQGGMFGKVGKFFSFMAEGGSPEESAFSGPSRFGQYLSGQVTAVGPAPQTFANSNYTPEKKPQSKPMSNQAAGEANSADMEAPTQEDNMTAPDMGDSVSMDSGGEGFAKGGKVPALLSPGEKYLNPAQAQAAKEGKVDPMKVGKTIPGTPKVGGAKNSYANDFVKADLDKGGLVLPRSVTQSKHPHWAAMKFVQAHMMAQGGKVKAPKKPKGT